MRVKLVMAVALLCLPGAGLAQSMNAEHFNKRALKLMAKGPMALFSRGEIRALMKEGQASGQAASARYKADKDAGRPTRFCAPQGPQRIGSDEFMKRLAAIPSADRMQIDMTEATTRTWPPNSPAR